MRVVVVVIVVARDADSNDDGREMTTQVEGALPNLQSSLVHARDQVRVVCDDVDGIVSVVVVGCDGGRDDDALQSVDLGTRAQADDEIAGVDG